MLVGRIKCTFSLSRPSEGGNKRDVLWQLRECFAYSTAVVLLEQILT
jgi:hypothetical protein